MVALTGAIWLALSCSQLIGVQDDGAIYMFSARYFTPWMQADPVAAVYAQDSPFPPLYPLLLALTGAAESPPVAHAVTVTTLLAALTALYAWLLALNLSRPVAVAAVATFAFCPGTVWLMFNLLSEPLYVAASLAACAVFVRTQGLKTERPDAASIAATALVAAALLTRSVGITLLPALALYLWQRLGARALVLMPLAVVPQGLWSMTHSSSLSYSGILKDALPRMLEHLGPFLQAQATVLLQGLRENLFMASPWYGAAFAGVAVGAAAARALRGRPDAVALFSYVGLLLLWPFPDQAARFAWVAVPLLIGHGLMAAQWAALRWHARAPALMPRLPGIAAVALVLAVAPSPALVAARWFDSEAQAHPELRHVGTWYSPSREDAYTYAPMEYAMALAFRDFGRRMGPDDCSMSILARLVAWYSGHYSLLPPPVYRDDAGFLESLRGRRCQYLVMVNAANEGFPTIFYPRERIGTLADVLERRTVMVNGAEAPLAILARLKPGPGR